MSDNKLPPELVEKMLHTIRKPKDVLLDVKTHEQCAQIAIDYADEYYAKELYLFMQLKQQRDELIEALNHINMHSLLSDYPVMKEKVNQLLKKHNDD